jgi:hypothetical protein
MRPAALLVVSFFAMVACKAAPPQEGKKCTQEGAGTCLDPTHMAKCAGGLWAIDPCLGPAACKELPDSFQCDQSIGAVGMRCEPGSGGCTSDGKQLLQCINNKMAVEAACGGANGCTYDAAAKVFHCDESVAAAGDLCSDEGKAACSRDKKQMLKCTSAHFVTDVLCKGPEGCHFEGSTAHCDMSLADVGDPCTEEGSYTCSADHTRALACKGGKLTSGRACKKGCSIKDGNVYCN